ncbi:MAG: amino acid adenylation domain-containing protein [Candidatus Aminicenantes bacterium]|nr:amino acid adenylation domain-containing protein [Candidatus Aminicenantes bacterium]
MLGGEAVRRHDIEMHREFFPHATLCNLYGQTESSYNAMEYITPGTVVNEIVLGKVVEGMAIFIVDTEGNEVLALETGEIVLACPHPALGYWNNVAATQKAFSFHPAYGKMYRTGDMGRLLLDGNIEFIGRKDNQVKIRGFRIELGEIESRLSKHEQIADALVNVVEPGDGSGDKYLCAYIVCLNPGESDMEIEMLSSRLKEYLAELLPDYMIPAYFIRLERLPLTPGGKVDRKALPLPEIGAINRRTFVAPRTWVEIKLLEIWRDVLKFPGVIGIADDFFQLGGHSLRATTLASRIQKALNVNAPLTEIFKRPTIQGLAKYIEAAKKERYASIEVVEKKEYHALAPAQKRLYILHRMESSSINYNMPQVIPIAGTIDVERVQWVFKELIRRHESLRTSFEMLDEEPVQRIHDEVEFETKVFGSPETFFQKGFWPPEAIIKSFIRPFDLAKAPLLRAGIIAGANGKRILIVDMHHIITDGTSNAILKNEFNVLYLGKGEELSHLRLQYKDYAQWQNSEGQRALIKEQEVYWLSMFAEEVPVLNLPTDFPRPIIQGFEGSRVEFILNRKESDALKALAKETGATLYISILSVFALLLSRLSGQEDIVVGAPVAARRHADLEKIIGMFVNTLALRNNVPAEASYREFVKEIKERTLKAYENQEYQFESLVEKINAARDISRNPVFDVAFNLLNMEDDADSSPIMDLGNPDRHTGHEETSKFDLTLTAVDFGERVHLSFEYCTRLFKAATIERFIAYFKKIVEELPGSIDQNLAEIEIITQDERDRVLYEFNNTGMDYPANKAIHQLFEEQASRTPDHISLVGADLRVCPNCLSYRQLNEQSDRLAGLLIEKGVLPDTIVAIMVERSVEMIVGIMGILKSGGAYLPIDPELPQDRIDYMLKDSATKILLTANEIASLPKECVFNSHHSSFIIHHSNLSYLIYTSGSTGKPKGVLTMHYNITRVARDANYISIEPGDRVLQLSNYAFDGSTFDIYGALLNGAGLVIISKNDVLAMDRLAGIIKREGVTVFFVTTALFNLLVDLEIGCFDRVRKILFGGERVSVEHTGKMLAYLGKGRIIHVYGPTETTVYATYYFIDAIDEASGTIPIGKPVSGTAIYILDENLNPVPIGGQGEIYIGGSGLARGYMNNPEFTCEKFKIINNNLKIKNGRDALRADLNACGVGEVQENFHHSILYRTGDLARWLPDGNIDFLGRRDFQVKIRGFRIELGEIEDRLLRHESIKEAAVLVNGEGGAEKRYLIAYIVLKKEIEASELREYLRGKLPDYMIPSYFVPLEKIPLTPNGKIDRRALPGPGLDVSDGYAAPGNEIEKKLVRLWAEILGRDALHASQLQTSIGINDNFFQLGGHSLKATILVSKIHKELEVKVELMEIFRTPFIRDIAGLIQGFKKEAFQAITPVEKKEYYPLSSAQKRLYFLQQLDLNSTGYNMPMVLHLGQGIKKDRLEFALKQLIARHESLRTSIERVNEDVVQRIHENVDFEIEYYDLATENTEDTENKFHHSSFIIQHFVRPFNLSRAPLIRSGLITLPDGDCNWMVDIHHIVSDGTSHTILVENFMQLYETGAPLEPLPLQYKDFAQWQNQLFASRRIKAQEDYWLQLYPGEIPRLNLVADYKRPGVFTFQGDQHMFKLEREDAVKFKVLGARHGGTLYMNIMAVLNTLLYKYTGQTDIIIGSGIAGRRHADIQGVVGMFVNTLAMRNYPEAGKHYDDFLKEVITHSVKAFENQDVQFEELVEKLDPERDTSRNPLFDIVMVVQNFRQAKGHLQLEIINENHPGSQYKNKTSKFDLTFFISEPDDDVCISLEYYTAIFKEETVKRLAGHFKNAIRSVINNPTIALKDIDILSEKEKEQVLFQFNDTGAEFPGDKAIHRLFEEQAAKTPGHVALVYKDQIMTYQELDRLANRLARYLLEEKKVGIGEPVGVWMSQPVYRQVALIGILKAGGAFIPLDPATPADRIEYIINDARIGVVISEKHHLRDLNRLQWECAHFHSYLCIDSFDIYAEEEQEINQLMDRELWEHVGESATDEITGGGWLSSYTGLPFSREEMIEYGDNTLKKLEPLLHAGMKALEIGCASGIGMYRIAPKVGLYYGTDLSAVIIEKNKKVVREKGFLNIQLACLPAHEIERVPVKDFDLVIINSVIQCFHGHNYLRKVLQKAVALLGDNGYLFIGDVMDQQKKSALVRDLTAFKEANRHMGYTTKTDFSAELFVSPGFWRDLAAEWHEIETATCSDKRFSIENELTKFRYDVLLKVNKSGKARGQKLKNQDDMRAVSRPGDADLWSGPGIAVGHLAYIIYTSGSTGKPKGVMVEHRSLVNLCYWHNSFYSVTSWDRATKYAGFGFDASVWEFFPYLLTGASICITPEEIILDIEALNRYYENNGVTIGFLPTQVCEQFMALNNTSLRILLTGGDKLKNYIKKNYRLYNNYGPTENTVVTTSYRVTEESGNIPIGKPVANNQVYILDRDNSLQPVGVPGELCIGGEGVARGYLNQPQLTAEKFINFHHSSFIIHHLKLYCTGDLARWLPGGNIEFLGRIDLQVKLRGYRIELGEIENRLLEHHNVKNAAVIDSQTGNGEKYLCAYIVLLHKDAGVEEIKRRLSGCLPPYMVPTRFIELENIPLTPSGKIDRKALLRYKDSPVDLAPGDSAPGSPVEKQVADAWKEVLQLENIGVQQNFFEIGGNSISILKVQGKLKKTLARDIPLVKLFKYPTIRDLAHYLEEEASGGRGNEELKMAGEIVRGKKLLRDRVSHGDGGGGSRMDIAVVGMAGVFPGAGNVRQFWENLKNGVESITFFSDEELEASGVSPQLLQDPNFVKVGSFLEGVEYFDAPFFSYTPREASIMDPQIRIFHQCVWHALEDAGYDPYSYALRIGLYAGSSANLNWEILTTFSGAGSDSRADRFQTLQLRDKDFLCSRVSYRLNLKGPSCSVQTACSTSLVAVHFAVQGLLNGDCEMALAGGVTISYPRPNGYLYQPGMINSPDGHCRAFDVMAKGTVGGNGAAVVVLKRLEDARRDHDNIHAIIKGAAINNDGFRKVSFSAPSVEGQAEVVRAAQAMAGVHPESISYIEAHGAGTELGDPVEVEALKLAFNTREKHFCGIGSVKTNIGHLDTAAGAAGLIKTILALEHRLIPPSLHFHTPNPKLDLENSPFYVVSRLTPWQTKGNEPRRAGVSALGIGGTNAHLIVEEAPPENKPRTDARKHRLILLSARTRTGLEQVAQNLVKHLENNPHIDFPNMAYTLQVGRRDFEYRKITVCPDIHTAVENLSSTVPGKAPAAFCPGISGGKVIFVFPGQGSQYVNMGLDLYKKVEIFREEMDRCFNIIKTQVGLDLKEILYPVENFGAPVIDLPVNASLVNFTFEYALAKLLSRLGITPYAMIGYSFGEYVSACLAGVFSFADGVKLVKARGKLMYNTLPAVMLSFPLTENEIKPLLKDHPCVSLAIINGSSCVVAGEQKAVQLFEAQMRDKRLLCVPVNMAHGVHSPLMEPIREELENRVREIRLENPRIPYISNVSGAWITARQATDPRYWGEHICSPVRFSDGLNELLKKDATVFIEIGPGRVLSNIILHQMQQGNEPVGRGRGPKIINIIKHQQEKIDDDYFLLSRLGKLWLYGVEIHWPGLYPEEKISRISLPGYPFEKVRCWLDDSLFKKAAAMLATLAVTPPGQAWDADAPDAPDALNALNAPNAANECVIPGETGPLTGFILDEVQSPRNEFEKKIAQFWQEVLGFEQVGIYHTFFDLNGDSLSATQVIARVRDAFQVEVPLKDFFAEPTVAQLAQRVKTLLVEKIKNLSPEEKKKLAGS